MARDEEVAVRDLAEHARDALQGLVGRLAQLRPAAVEEHVLGQLHDHVAAHDAHPELPRGHHVAELTGHRPERREPLLVRALSRPGRLELRLQLGPHGAEVAHVATLRLEQAAQLTVLRLERVDARVGVPQVGLRLLVLRLELVVVGLPVPSAAGGREEERGEHRRAEQVRREHVSAHGAVRKSVGVRDARCKLERMGDERRQARRYALWIPVQVQAGDDVQMLAVSKNISWGGVLVIAGASLEAGERVHMTLQVPGEDARELAGEIIRVEPNEEDPDGLWRYRLAVRFDETVSDLEPAFERLEGKAPL
ncbi:MAG TPA: hypothetical protein DEF51_23260 [Myxococcales bacterium]|nr:hypothetical protein [Myxococcales bacterium]